MSFVENENRIWADHIERTDLYYTIRPQLLSGLSFVSNEK